MPTFVDRHGVRGAVISAVDLVNGIGKCMGLDTIAVPGATGYFETNYRGKAEYALDALDRYDFVYVHVEAPDEAAHAGLVDMKVKCIERFDELVVGTVLDGIGRFDEWRVLVTSDHATSLKKKTHVSDMVPFAFVGTGVASNGARAFNESSAADVGLTIDDGYRLMDELTEGGVG
jgi:2,3-bisphosphoglycerate-independent phosphoglycerate mutase